MISLNANLSKFQFIVLGINNISLLSLIVTNEFVPCSGEVELLGKTMLIKLKLKNTSTTYIRKYLLKFIPLKEDISYLKR